IVLHPRYKTSYFTRAKWPQQWITDAKALARKVWTENYKKTTSLPAVAEESRAREPNVRDS
ncbi:hypothetical protein BYT27DRAFT_7109409, partial [Phlegmacium glaucopus]